MLRSLARLGAVVIAGLAVLIGFSGTAAAHVTVQADVAVRGGSAEISFRVPTESDTARTVKVAIAFPTETPIAGVSVLPIPGWTHQVTRIPAPPTAHSGHGNHESQVVSQIEWSATGVDAGPGPGEYQVFRIAAGELPDTDRLIFKAVQTYSDGQVARWIDPPTDGTAEGEFPAPVLTLTTTTAVTNVGLPTSTPGTPALAWWAVAVTAVAVLAALWAVVISLRTVRRQGGDPPTTN